MARDPDERFDSADAMAEALAPARTSALPGGAPSADVVWEDETGVLTPTDVMEARSPTTTVVRRARRRTDRRPLIALAAVAVAVAAVIAFGVSRRGDSAGGTPPVTGASTTVAPGVPATTLPAPLATALDRLDEAIRS
jgi:hypothetical protein